MYYSSEMVVRRRTDSKTAVLVWLLNHHEAPAWGLQIASDLGMASPTVYRILDRFQQDGIVSSEWETLPDRSVPRPRRRLYTLTTTGRAWTVNAAREMNERQASIPVRVRPAMP